LTPSLAGARAKPVHQRISDTQLRKARHSAVRVLFAVTYPDVARQTSRGSARVTVFTAPRRGTPMGTFDKRIPRKGGGKVYASVLVRGRAAARLRRSGLNRLRTLKMVLVTSRDHRQLDADRFIDFTQMVTRPLSSAPRKASVGRARANSRPNLGGDAVTVVIKNKSSQAVHLTAGPLGCVYDGVSNSYVSAFNYDLNPTESVAHRIEKDSNAGHKFISGFGLAPSSGYGGGTVVTPALTDGLYNPSVKGLLFAAINKYTSLEADPQIFAGVLGQLPDRSEDTCFTTKGHFVIGADGYTSGDGPRPTDDRDGAVFQVTGDGKIQETAPLTDVAPAQLQVMQNGRNEIDIKDGVPPACGSLTQWMSCHLPAGGPLAATTRLVDLAIPGSHDSATPSAASDSDWFFKQNGSCSSWASEYDATPGRVYDAAFTQAQTIPDQLDSGIRYLDLRLAYDVGSGSGKMSDPGDQWRFLHTLFVMSSLRGEVQDIANWARTHPNEVLIADMNHICTNHTSGPSEAQQMQLLANDLAAPDKTTGLSLCDVAYQLPAGAAMDTLPSTTLAAVRASGRNVILLTGSDQLLNPNCGAFPLHDQTGNNGAGSSGQVPINHLWPEESGPGVCSTAAPTENSDPADRIRLYPFGQGGDYTLKRFGPAPTLNAYRSASPPPFTQTQSQYTADTAAIIFGVLFPKAGGGCGSLQNYELPYIKHYRDDVLEGWGNKTNIAIGDFVTADDFITRIIGYGPG
jgi:hypothetical protein